MATTPHISRLYLSFILCTSLAQSLLVPLRYFGYTHNPTTIEIPQNIDVHCVHEDTWGNSFEAFNLEDCPAAISSIEAAEDLDPMRAAVPKEFITRKGVPHGSHGDPIMTPRKYDSGECTASIVMVSEVHSSDFPGAIEPSQLTSDVSSFRLVESAASEVYEICGKGMRVPGWAQIGKSRNACV